MATNKKSCWGLGLPFSVHQLLVFQFLVIRLVKKKWFSNRLYMFDTGMITITVKIGCLL